MFTASRVGQSSLAPGSDLKGATPEGGKAEGLERSYMHRSSSSEQSVRIFVFHEAAYQRLLITRGV